MAPHISACTTIQPAVAQADRKPQGGILPAATCHARELQGPKNSHSIHTCGQQKGCGGRGQRQCAHTASAQPADSRHTKHALRAARPAGPASHWSLQQGVGPELTRTAGPRRPPSHSRARSGTLPGRARRGRPCASGRGTWCSRRPRVHRCWQAEKHGRGVSKERGKAAARAGGAPLGQITQWHVRHATPSPKPPSAPSSELAAGRRARAPLTCWGGRTCHQGTRWQRIRPRRCRC